MGQQGPQWQPVDTVSGSRQEIFEALEKFRDWWLSAKDSTCPVGSTARLNLLRKLKNIEIRGVFPSMAVCISICYAIAKES